MEQSTLGEGDLSGLIKTTDGGFVHDTTLIDDYDICSEDVLAFKVVIYKEQDEKGRQLVEVYDSDHYGPPAGLIKSYKAREIFIPGDGNLKGESILLRIGKNRYVFIGMIIYEFQSLSPIVKYDFTMATKYYSQPYAVDRQGNYYIMLECVIMVNREDGGVVRMIKENRDDDYNPLGRENPYDIYCVTSFISKPPRNYPEIRKIWRKLNGSNIKYFYSKGKKTKLSHDISPLSMFEEYKPCYIIRKDNVRVDILRAYDLQVIMADFGMKVGVQPMDKCNIIRYWHPEFVSNKHLVT